MINAYRVGDQEIKWKEPLLIEVKAAVDMFCILDIEGKEYAVKGSDVIAAMQAAFKT
jgi:hypothetical protein